MIYICCDWLGGLLSGFLGAVGSGISSSAARYAADQQLLAQREANATNIQLQNMANQSNMDLAKYAWQNEVDMWNKQNEYNSPAHQRALLEAAGYNPYLAMGADSRAGDGPSFASHPTQAAQVEPAADLGSAAAAQVIGNNMQSIFSQAMRDAYEQKQLELADVNMDYKREQVKNTAADTVLKIEKQSSQRMNNQLFQDTLDFRKALIQDSSRVLNRQAAYAESIYNDGIIDKYGENVMTTFDLNKAKADYMKAMAAIKFSEQQQAEKYFAQRLKNMAKQYDLMNAQEVLAGSKNEEQEYINWFLKNYGMYPGTQNFSSATGYIAGLFQKGLSKILNGSYTSERQSDGTYKYYDQEGKDVTEKVEKDLEESAQNLYYDSTVNSKGKKNRPRPVITGGLR